MKSSAQLCETFEHLSVRAFEWANRQERVKEETLTDWLLDRASLMCPFVIYVPFTRHQEAFKGADWEWWIVSGRRGFAMRIQAKRLHAGENHRSALAYKNAHGRQIDHLLNHSRREGLAPFYCFYNADPNLITRCKWPQETHGKEGILLASAVQMKSLLSTRAYRGIKTHDISSFLIPLSCMFCCPISHAIDPIDRVRNNLIRYFDLDDNEEMPRIHDKLPKRVVSLMRGEHNELGANAWEKKYLEDARPETGAIVVTDVAYMNENISVRNEPRP